MKKVYCTYSFTLVNKIFIRSFVLLSFFFFFFGGGGGGCSERLLRELIPMHAVEIPERTQKTQKTG